MILACLEDWKEHCEIPSVLKGNVVAVFKRQARKTSAALWLYRIVHMWWMNRNIRRRKVQCFCGTRPEWFGRPGGGNNSFPPFQVRLSGAWAFLCCVPCQVRPLKTGRRISGGKQRSYVQDLISLTSVISRNADDMAGFDRCRPGCCF
jgi:hypothetical protein